MLLDAHARTAIGRDRRHERLAAAARWRLLRAAAPRRHGTGRPERGREATVAPRLVEAR